MSNLDLKEEHGGAVPRPEARDRKARGETREAGENAPSSVNRSGAPRRTGDFARQHMVAIAIVAVIAVTAVAGGVMWWLHARNYQSTDDAFVDARTVSISSQVIGMITGVPVTDNQLVDTGGLLLQIDPRDYEAAVAQAEAQVDQSKAAIANLDAQIDAERARIYQAQRQVLQTQAALTFAQQENDRAQNLVRRGAGTQEQAQQTTSNSNQAQANVESAQANEMVAEKQIAVLATQRQSASAQLAQMQAALELTQTNLTRTRITAPERGRTTALSAALGTLAQPGMVLMMFVPEQKWVTANFKETQLTLMRPGQPVDISVDAYPGHIFRGHVESVQAGTGAAFSLLPPENATGNYVKVVQRVPVKIAFDEPPDVYLGPGMSVVPNVKVR